MIYRYLFNSYESPASGGPAIFHSVYSLGILRRASFELRTRAMSTQKTKCLFCRRRYLQAAAYEKHLQSRHAELYESLYKSTFTASPHAFSPTDSYAQLVEAEKSDIGIYPPGVNESDYESDHGSVPSDSEEHPSDGEDIPAAVVAKTGSRVDQYKNAGRPLKNTDPSLRFEMGLLDDPWRPFHALDDFKLAKWFITSNVPRSRIDEYFVSGLSASPKPCFQSAYKLDQFISALDPYQDLLVWNEGTYNHDGRSSVFFYRDIVRCVEYLLTQPAYREDIVYGPIREYDESGQRLYSEMHTADWWWETQVRKYSCYALILYFTTNLLCCCCRCAVAAVKLLLLLLCFFYRGRLNPFGVDIVTIDPMLLFATINLLLLLSFFYQ